MESFKKYLLCILIYLAVLMFFNSYQNDNWFAFVIFWILILGPLFYYGNKIKEEFNMSPEDKKRRRLLKIMKDGKYVKGEADKVFPLFVNNEKKINIIYQDFSNNLSKRTIRIEAFYCYGNGNNNVMSDLYMLAYCEAREDYRSFSVKKIKEIFDIDNNEVCIDKANVYKWFYYNLEKLVEDSEYVKVIKDILYMGLSSKEKKKINQENKIDVLD